MILYACEYINQAIGNNSANKLGVARIWQIDLFLELAEDKLYFTDSTQLEKTYTLGCFPYNSTETDYLTLIHTSNTAIYLA